MKKIATAILLLPIWASATYANGIDIPELGAHIAQLPAAGGSIRVIRRNDGYLAIVPIGQATLTIARLDEPLPAGSDIGNAAFRAAQRAEFYESPVPQTQEHPTTIDGHPAWTTLSAASGGGSAVSYSCITYTVVDEHLYRLLSSATSEEKKRPADFDATVRVMSELTFTPVNRSSAQSSQPARGLLKMPKGTVPSRDLYPASLVALGGQGIADIEYRIDGKGHVRDVRQTYRDSRLAGEAAEALLKNTTFPVNSRWETDGHQHLRFTTEVQFWFNRCPQNWPPQTQGAEVLTICSAGRL